MELKLDILEAKHLSLAMDFTLLEEVASTNDEAFKALEESPFCVVVAKRQNSGRGRLNRKWEGKEGDCIFYSAGFKLPQNFNITPLTCLVAIEILNLIDPKNSYDLSIKWPNDIYYKGRKLCGILTESKAKNGRIDSVVIGIGLNLNMPIDSENFRREPSCLREFCTISIEDIILNLSKAVKNTYNKLSGDFENFSEAFAKRDYLKGKEISIEKSGETFFFKALGVDAQANLIVATSDGNKDLINSGEVNIL